MASERASTVYKSIHRNSKATRAPEEESLVWFYEICEIPLRRVPRFTNSEDFWKYVWFLIKWHCNVHLTKRSPNSESQSLSKVSCCLFRIVLSNHEKCLTGMYRGSRNIRIVEIFRKMASQGISTFYRSIHRNPKSTRWPVEPSLVWFYEISEITLRRVPRFTNSEIFWKNIWFLIKWHCNSHLTKRAQIVKAKVFQRFRVAFFWIVLSNHEKCLTGVYRRSPNIEMLKNCWNL